MSWLKEKYESEIKKELRTKFGYKNVNEVPQVKRIVVNCVTRDCAQDGKQVESIIEELKAITGQRPVVARAKKSIASFKIRTGQPLGAFVTLRGTRMFEFMERFFNISLPRVRDFRGVNPNGFDGKGNYTMGMKEQIIFPEINYDKVDRVRGLGITFVTTAKTNEEGRELLRQLGMPFSEKEKKVG